MPSKADRTKLNDDQRMEGEKDDVDQRRTITRDYYSSRPKTIDTMLGGFAQVHDSDIEESRQIIERLFKERKDRSICLELGCGIGRVSKHLLSNYFDRLDINDLLDDYITQTKSLFEDEPEKIDRTFVCSIADIEFDFSQRYDLIWAQWVLGYLKHEDLVKLLKKLRDTLKKNGFLVIKDNCVAQGEESQFDADDQYYIRTGEQFYDAAHRSGFVVIKDQRSKLKRVVRDLLPIRIFVLSIK